MNTRMFRLSVVAVLLVIHTAVTVRAMMEVGFVGIFEAALSTWAARQVFSDLGVALVIATGFMLADARKQGITAWPFVLAMLPLGSFAPLAYLLWRDLRGHNAPSVLARA
jgi:hypothetical protein